MVAQSTRMAFLAFGVTERPISHLDYEFLGVKNAANCQQRPRLKAEIPKRAYLRECE